MTIPYQEIRAVYDAHTIRVYQAYSHPIADSALQHQRFVSPPFKMSRMTWIKPSFLWMMYRAGWGQKDEGQKRILAIDISREGFEWALAHSCASHAGPDMSLEEYRRMKDGYPVRFQWDPERDLHHQPLPHRSLQLGLCGEAVQLYVNPWTQKITDITAQAAHMQALVQNGQLQQAQTLLPAEQPYPLPEHLRRQLQMLE